MSIFKHINQFKYLLGLVFFLSLAILFERNIKTQINQDKELKNAANVISERTKKVDNILENIESRIDSSSLHELMNHQDFLPDDLYEKEGIVILCFSSDSLVFWSDNSIPVDNYSVDNQLYSDMAKLKNGWFIIRQNYIDDYELFGLILVKKEYSYQNEFIKSGFFSDLNIKIPVSVTLNEKTGYLIYDYTHKYLFSFLQNSNVMINTGYSYASGFMYLIGLFFFFIAIRKFIKNAKSDYLKYIYMLVLALILVSLRYFMLEYHFPSVFRQFELFQPQHFAISNFVPSLGDLLLHAGFILFFILIFYLEFNLSISDKVVGKSLILILFIVFSFSLFVYIQYFFESLILHSSISFNVYRFFDLTIYSLMGFLIIVFFLSTIYLFLDKILVLIRKNISFKELLIVFFPTLIALTVILYLAHFKINLFSIIFYALLFISISFVRIRKEKYSYPLMIFIILIFASYTVAFITIIGAQKDKGTKKVLAVNLANEHDQIAEMLLEGLESGVENDTIIRDLLTWPDQNEGAILEHLQMTYFSGYFRKYDLSISYCSPDADLTVSYDNSTEVVPCYPFFKNLLEKDGIQIQGSRFYFLDNLDGRISYLGQFVYKKTDWGSEMSLYISLKSKLVNQELGYPELLLDSRMSESRVLSDYSYAKYKNDDLMTKGGSFSYQLRFPENWNSNQEYYFTTDHNYEHLIYKIDDTTSIVISSQRIRFIDILASFSYIFVFFYIFHTLIFFLLGFPGNIKGFNYDFKNKIKFSMIGVLLLSLVFVGFGTIYYNINQFEKNLYDGIGEKIQSVLVEMKQKLGGELELNADYSSYLNYLLIKFSSVFNIDINLYDINGNLLASSQSKIFEKGLMGNKMNIDAYREMVIDKNGKYIHKESIGDLSYYSAYIPFTNDGNELLAYLNLPYFTKQSALKKEIYTIVVAVVNIYFFLILLSVVVAIFVSNNITKPLQLIQERFRAIDLGKKNEPIVYESHDEIGSLIKEYNRMVSELSENAEKLAKSERESAWREMAKQIAHEIKNPLTPMKLSVQYLQKAWKDEIPDFDKRLEKFSNSLISQINNLSSIATEFSNFAKMPRARAEQVDIISKLTDSINLLENTENIKFNTDFGKKEELYVYADKEQLLIVFSNLIQNGIQSIPKDREGEISIKVEEINDYVQVTIRDNGYGIPDDLKDKLFIPNFTTKSSGMGLGLAIVKNIVENAGGDIWYETLINIGTSFFVTFPIYRQTD